MKKQMKTASEVKNSSRTSTLAHETRKNKQRLSMLVIATLVLAAVFTSCDDNDDDNNGKVKLPETITNRDGNYTKFEYDSQMRITKNFEYRNGILYLTNTLTYIGNDLVKMVLEYQNDTYTEEYAKEGNEITITYYDDIGYLSGTNILYLNNDGFPDKYDFILGHNLGVVNNYTIQSGNITKIMSTQVHWEITEKDGSVNYKYDDKKSPFTHCATPKWWNIITRNVLMYNLDVEFGCKNNVIEENRINIYWKGSSTNGKVEYTYEYDSDGFPTKLTSGNNVVTIQYK